jgi:hypothetical protein
LTGTMKEKPMFVERVWIDGSNVRWELDQLGEKPSAIAVVFRGDSAVYVKGPEKLLKTKAPVGDTHPFSQGITWRTAVHTIREKGVPADAKLLAREKVDGGEVAVIEMTIPDQRRVGLGIRGSYLGYAGIAGSPTLRPSRVRLHIRLPEHFPILEEYPGRDVQFRYEEQTIRFDGGLAPSSITYAAKSPEGKIWEMAAHFQKYESLWLLQMAKNRQDGVVGAALEVSEVSTAPPDKALFEVPAAK